MTDWIRVVGSLLVGPPSVRRRWFGLRRQRLGESVVMVGWWFALPSPSFDVSGRWDELVAAAIAAGTYRDYREGTPEFGAMPDRWPLRDG